MSLIPLEIKDVKIIQNFRGVGWLVLTDMDDSMEEQIFAIQRGLTK